MRRFFGWVADLIEHVANQERPRHRSRLETKILLNRMLRENERAKRAATDNASDDDTKPRHKPPRMP